MLNLHSFEDKLRIDCYSIEEIRAMFVQCSIDDSACFDLLKLLSAYKVVPDKFFDAIAKLSSEKSKEHIQIISLTILSRAVEKKDDACSLIHDVACTRKSVLVQVSAIQLLYHIDSKMLKNSKNLAEVRLADSTHPDVKGLLDEYMR